MLVMARMQVSRKCGIAVPCFAAARLVAARAGAVGVVAAFASVALGRLAASDQPRRGSAGTWTHFGRPSWNSCDDPESIGGGADRFGGGAVDDGDDGVVVACVAEMKGRMASTERAWGSRGKSLESRSGPTMGFVE